MGRRDKGIDRVTYRLIHIPAPVLASLLRLHDPLVHPEVPVHVCRFLPLPFRISLEPPPTLCTWWSEGLIEGREKVGSESDSIC